MTFVLYFLYQIFNIYFYNLFNYFPDIFINFFFNFTLVSLRRSHHCFDCIMCCTFHIFLIVFYIYKIIYMADVLSEIKLYYIIIIFIVHTL